jgi:hypothetical protein
MDTTSNAPSTFAHSGPPFDEKTLDLILLKIHALEYEKHVLDCWNKFKKAVKTAKDS